MSKEKANSNAGNLDSIFALQQEFKEIIQDIIGPFNDENCMPPIEDLVLEPNFKPAIGYIRYSDKKQDDNNSVAIQKRQIENKAQLEGYRIIIWCMDRAVSATHKSALKRPWMKVLFECASSENFNGAIFFCEESRVSRQVNDFVKEVYNPLKETKETLKFFSTTEPTEWDPSKPHIQAKLLIYRNESEYKKDRTVRYQQNCLDPLVGQKPIRPGAALPFGYVRDKEGEIVIDNSENRADIVYLIYYLSSWGYSNRHISSLLNKCEISSPKGKTWVASMIDKILQNLFYQGHLTWNVRKSHSNSARKELGQFDLFENYHDAIVPQHLADVVKQMKSFKNQFGRNMDTPFTLKDLLFCKDCDAPLTSKNFTSGQSNKIKHVYRCVHCNKCVEIEKVHDLVFKKFFDHTSKNSVVMKREVISTLKSWKKTLKQKQDYISKTLQHVKEQERFIVYGTNQVEREFANSIAITLNYLSEKGTQLANLIDQIEQMLDANELDNLFTRFFDHNSNYLSALELRSLALFFIERVELNLSTINAAIQYKLTPFIDQEKWISQATADLVM